MLLLVLLVLNWPLATVFAQEAKDSTGRRLPPEAAPLEPFYQALYNLESGQSRRPVVIIQLGDSHTAGDHFTGRLRELFQGRFGDAGRGMMPPGIPYRYYRPTKVKVEQTNDWVVYNSLGEGAKGLFGISGFRVGTSAADATLLVDATDKDGFNQVEVEFIAQPDGGTITIYVDDALAVGVSTRDDKLQARRVSFTTPRSNRRRLEVVAKGDGPVNLLSWTVQNNRPGIVFDSHGIIGAKVNVIGQWNPQIVAWELAHRDPALLIVEYGGNEGFDDDLTAEAYEKTFRSYMALLRKAAPRASILVIGPADGNRLPKYCLSLDPPRKEFGCSPLTEAERRDYRAMLKVKDPVLCRWHTPPNLAMVRRIQRAAAAADGYAFWDWSSVMNGECGLHAWMNKTPPWAATDHLHLRTEGANYSADILFKIIMSYYEHYRTARIR